jgi:sirohydrochlorin ferrochelatase
VCACKLHARGAQIVAGCLLALLLAGCGSVPPERRLDLTVTAAGYSQSRLEAQVGEQLFITLRNEDTQAHSLAVELPSGRRTVSTEAGVDAILAISARDAGTFRLFCTVPGHSEQAELVVLPAP